MWSVASTSALEQLARENYMENSIEWFDSLRM